MEGARKSPREHRLMVVSPESEEGNTQEKPDEFDTKRMQERGFKLDSNDKIESCPEFLWLSLSPDRREKVMVKEVLNDCIIDGVPKLLLETMPDNEGSTKEYRMFATSNYLNKYK